MAFNLPHFLRRPSRPSLREYFRLRSITLSAEFDWSAAQRAYVEGLRTEVENLPDGDRERVYQDFEHADLLSDDPGQLAIRSVFAEHASFLRTIEGMGNSEARALAAMMEDEALFRKALAARFADRLHTGRSWSGFLSRQARRPAAQTRPKLSWLASRRTFGPSSGRWTEAAASSALTGSSATIPERRESSRSTPCSLKACLRQAMSSRPTGWCRAPAARCLRPRFAMISALGTVDVVCKGGRKVRLDIARSFINRLLGSENDPEAVRLRRVSLDGLKSMMPFDTEPSDGVRRVAVTLLRLRDADESFGRITLEVGDDADSEDIWTRSAEWFEDFDPLTSDQLVGDAGEPQDRVPPRK